jgi:hypothetical protein
MIMTFRSPESEVVIDTGYLLLCTPDRAPQKHQTRNIIAADLPKAGRSRRSCFAIRLSAILRLY